MGVLSVHMLKRLSDLQTQRRSLNCSALWAESMDVDSFLFASGADVAHEFHAFG